MKGTASAYIKIGEMFEVWQAAEKLGLKVGRGFIPGIKAAKSTWALAPEGSFPPVSHECRSFPAACLVPEASFSSN
jgi:hypothetical protein